MCTGQPGRSLSLPVDGVVAVGVDPAVGVGDDQLVGVVAGEVGEHRARVAVAAHLEREAVEHALVAVQEHLAAVLAGHRRARARRRRVSTTTRTVNA